MGEGNGHGDSKRGKKGEKARVREKKPEIVGKTDEEAESKGEMGSDVWAKGEKSPRKFNSGL